MTTEAEYRAEAERLRGEHSKMVREAAALDRKGRDGRAQAAHMRRDGGPMDQLLDQIKKAETMAGRAMREERASKSRSGKSEQPSLFDAALAAADALHAKADSVSRVDAGSLARADITDPYAELQRANKAYETHRNKPVSPDYYATRGANVEGQRLLNEVQRWERAVRQAEKNMGF